MSQQLDDETVCT